MSDNGEDFESADEDIPESIDAVPPLVINRQPINEDEPSITCDTTAQKDNVQETGWASWSSWGASIMSVASSSVTTFTNQVGEGWNTVMETVETGLGAPAPEDFVETELKQEKSSEELCDHQESVDNNELEANVKPEDGKAGFWSSLGIHEFDEITSLVTDKGKKLVAGGLDVLETIGKKTYDVVTLTDPGLQKTRDLIKKGKNRPNLSALLREAKDTTKNPVDSDDESADNIQKINFSVMFDEFNGLSHLEALEMLSSQCELRVSSLQKNQNIAVIEDDLTAIEQAFASHIEVDSDNEDEKEHNFRDLILDYLSQLQLTSTPDKLTMVQERIHTWLIAFTLKEPYESDPPRQAKEVHTRAIESLAELTSRSMEQLHKIAELILLQSNDSHMVVERAKALASITQVLCTEIHILSTKFSSCLSQIAAESTDAELIHPIITIIYLEASNSVTYIQDAFQLLLPVLQQAAIECTGT